jgi:hypothetical protein
MESLIKYLPIDVLVGILQLALLKYGNKFKDKDDNDTGTDDATGNALIAVAPVIPALLSGSESLKKKVMLGAYNAFGNYLGLKPVSETSIK